MTIYLDIVLLENLCMNYIILFATGYIMKLKRKPVLILASSLLGGIYSVLAYMQILPIYTNIWMKITLSILMVYVAFRAKKIKILAKQVLIFYLTSFVFGGCAFALLYFIKPQEVLFRNGLLIGTYPMKIALLGGILGFIVTHIAFKIVKEKIGKGNIIYNVTIYMGGKKVSLHALLDTGNLLKDPITGIPVMIVEKQVLYQILPNELLDNLEKMLGGDDKNSTIQIQEKEYMSRFRLIPFSSIGKQNGLLLGFKADEVMIEGREEKCKEVIIGIYEKKLGNNRRYQALIGLDILEGSERNECIADAKI